MMLRVVLFEIYRRYRLRLAPGATVIKNTVVTTKPAAVRHPHSARSGGTPDRSQRVERPDAPRPRRGPARGESLRRSRRRAPTGSW